ncbi:hypothetical protein TE07_005306 [Salmonella enterica subsp. enterica]|nr:hypothetical protein [Salmonella enterica subsp. enterica serovar O rough]EED2890671.1 hypothetical protein [Salmonella enterica subsp. enterica serovar Tanger]EGI5492085.1 hypothetical protein [Salmonella enterica subsp. enterica serovar Urbana]
MEHSTIFEALIGGLVSGTIAAGFIWILFTNCRISLTVQHPMSSPRESSTVAA